MINGINWANVGIVLGIIAGLSLIFCILILIVTKVCKIEEDEKVLKILENLAGANCGGCGHSGCASFAKAVAEGKADVSACHAIGNEQKKVICDVLGVEFASSVPTVAVVACNGGDHAVDKFEYIGNDGCINQTVFHNGKKLCANACLGGGTCMSVCPEHAIKIINNIAVIDKTACISCGACMLKCPRSCIVRIPVNAPVYVACSTLCKGKEVSNQCTVGCFGCGLCARTCPQKAIKMVDNLPVIDYTKCNGCLTCVAKCPKKCIHEFVTPQSVKEHIEQRTKSKKVA